MSIHIPETSSIADDQVRKEALEMAIRIAESEGNSSSLDFEKILENAKRIVMYIKKGE
jgi:hypothetical protein